MIQRFFTYTDIEKEVKQYEKDRKQQVCDAMAFVAAGIVNEAKIKGSYLDDTSNLRSSIGFKINIEGKELQKLFYGKNSKGVEQGKTVANENLNTKETSIVIVAGMDYAADVEKKGYTVLSAFLDVENFVKKVDELLK